MLAKLEAISNLAHLAAYIIQSLEASLHGDERSKEERG